MHRTTDRQPDRHAHARRRRRRPRRGALARREVAVGDRRRGRRRRRAPRAGAGRRASSASTSPATAPSSTSRSAPHGTPFQLAAWQALRTIPYGETVSYGEQARRLGDRNKARAVGAANGRNPLPIIVPCHRVVGANGHLTGFGGGIEMQGLAARPRTAVRQRYLTAAGCALSIGTRTRRRRHVRRVRRGRGRGRTARGAGRPLPACASASSALGLERLALGVVGVLVALDGRDDPARLLAGQLDEVVVLEQVADDGRRRRPRRRRSRRASSG